MKIIDESLALEKKEQTKFASKIKILKDQVKDGEVKVLEEGSAKERAIIYIGHLPHGFYEKELKEYFGQFGKVIKVTVPRAKRSGRSRTYAYVEFLFMDVAKIAAETMDNYLMFDKRLVVKVLPQEKCRKLKFGGRLWAENSTPYISKLRAIAKKKNEAPSTETHIKNMNRQVSLLSKKFKKLAALGINHTIKPVNVPKGMKVGVTGKKTVKKTVVGAAKEKKPVVEKIDVATKVVPVTANVKLSKKPVTAKVQASKKPVAAKVEASKKPIAAKVAGKKATVPKKVIENKKTVEAKVAKKTAVKIEKPKASPKKEQVLKAKKQQKENVSQAKKPEANPSPKKVKVSKAKKQQEVKSSPKKVAPVKGAPKMEKKSKEPLAIKKPALKTTMKKKEKVVAAKKTLSKDAITAMMNDSNLVTKKTFKSKK